MKSLIIILLMLPQALFSQENSADNHIVKLGLTFSASPVIQTLQLLNTEEDPEISGYDFFSAGIIGLISLEKYIAIETGIQISRGRFEINPWGAHSQNSSEYLSLVTVPLEMRSTFFRYFFVTGGLQFDFDFSEPGELHNQSGVGISLGSGLNYDFKNGLSIFLNPQIKVHSMISYTKVLSADKIIETAIRLGLLYRL